MNITGIIRDALKYPLQDWKKILLLGIILLISSTLVDLAIFVQNNIIMGIITIVGLLLVLFVYGYSLKIINSSLAGNTELPDMNNWINMFISGVKVLIVGIVYFIPIILVVVFTAILSPQTITSIFIGLGLNPLAITGSFLEAILVQGLGNLVPLLFNVTNTTITGTITLLYMIMITPVLMIAIANMGNNNQMKSAFKIRILLEKMGSIGWNHLIEWYIITVILYLIIFAAVNVLYFAVGPLMILILVPYYYIYQSRSIALIYQINKESKALDTATHEHKSNIKMAKNSGK
jgi:hypothetical protein